MRILTATNQWFPDSTGGAARLAADLDKVTATGSDAHSTHEMGRAWMEMEEYANAADFLAKLGHARHVVTSESGTGRRASTSAVRRSRETNGPIIGEQV